MTLTGHRAAVNSVQYRDGLIVSASGDRSIKIWDLATGQELRTILGHSRGIACIQFDGNLIVSGSSDQTIRVWYVKKFSLHLGTCNLEHYCKHWKDIRNSLGRSNLTITGLFLALMTELFVSGTFTLELVSLVSRIPPTLASSRFNLTMSKSLAVCKVDKLSCMILRTVFPIARFLNNVQPLFMRCSFRFVYSVPTLNP